MILMTSRAAILAAAFFLVTSAKAENLVRLDISSPERESHVDLDSVTLAGDAKVRFQLRSKSRELGSNKSEWFADCKVLSAGLVSATNGSPNPLDPFSELGEGAARACDHAMPEVGRRLRSTPTDAECGSTSDTGTFSVCNSSLTRLRYGILRAQAQALTVACGNDSLYERELKETLERTKRCHGSERCIRWAMFPLRAAVLSDYGHMIPGAHAPKEPMCNSVAVLKAKAQEEKNDKASAVAVEKAEDALKACARRAAVRLDDRTSDAKTVASSAVNACKSESGKLDAAVVASKPEGSSASVKAALVEDLTTAILERRALKRAQK